MTRKPNQIRLLMVLVAITIAATVVELSYYAGNTNLDAETELTITPLPPWNSNPGASLMSSRDLLPLKRLESLKEQFTNYMSEHSVDVKLRRCHYDKPRDSYDIEFDWLIPMTDEAGTDRITLIPTSEEGEYAIDTSPDAPSESTIAADVLQKFTATLPNR